MKMPKHRENIIESSSMRSWRKIKKCSHNLLHLTLMISRKDNLEEIQEDFSLLERKMLVDRNLMNNGQVFSKVLLRLRMLRIRKNIMLLRVNFSRH